MTANIGQKQVIENTEGIFLVDAGAGTGKTFAITKRYLNLLDKGIKPPQILLVTFTNNAAENMKDKIINESYQKHSIKELLDANICTFHSFCNTLLKKNGFNIPKILGINDSLSMNYQIIENSVLEEKMFRQFYNNFQKKHIKDYPEFFDLINNQTNLPLYLIKKLCCNGIFPTKDSWFNNGEELLKGNWKRYQKVFQKINKEKLNEKGNKQDSDIAATFRMKLRYKSYHQNPEENLFFNGKTIREGIAEQSFNEERHELFNFIHKLYFEYVQYSIKRNKLNFDFLIMLTFIMLFKDHKLRQENSFEYVMVDEFQDTNEIQFMLTLLLMKTNNLCAVGDWKQGIYGFRNATIENVTLFQERLNYFKEILNSDYDRISFPIQHKKLSFDINYRSSQKILDFSEKSLLTKGSDKEIIDKADIQNNITSLNANFDFNNTNIEFLQTSEKEDEPIMILQKIQEIVNNPNYKIKDEDTERTIQYSDIAILSRTRTFGLNLQNLALEYNIPLNYDGGIELFKTEPAIILLGWLRVMINKDKKAGWIPILENEDYTYSQIRKILDKKEYPTHLISFRNELLKEKESIRNLAERIFSRYCLDCKYADALIVELDRLFNLSLISLSELVYFIEQNIATNQTYNISINNSDNSVMVETIHAAKGLEYPIVFIVDCNEFRFPSKKMSEPVIFYNEILGLRCRKHKAEKNSYNYVFNSLSTDLLLSRLDSDFDEERRLLYVAITRAKQYVFFTSNKNSSLFFENLKKDTKFIETPEIKKQAKKEDIDFDEIILPKLD